MAVIYDDGEMWDDDQPSVVHVMVYDPRTDRFGDVTGWHERSRLIQDMPEEWIVWEPRIDDEATEEEIIELADDDGPLEAFTQSDLDEAASLLAELKLCDANTSAR